MTEAYSRSWLVAVVGIAAMGCGAATTRRPSEADVDARARAAVDAFTNADPRLTADGRVVFSSNRDGVSQLYVARVDAPDEHPRRLPAPNNERAIAPHVMPNGSTILFLSDHSGDRRNHIYRVELDGTNLVDLTPSPELMRSSLHVARTSGVFAYTAHALDDQTTHIYVQTLDGPPREIYRDASIGGIADVSADGSRLIFVRTVTELEQVAVVIDTTTGAATRLYPREGDRLAIGDAAFSADGNHVLLGVDQPNRPTQILRLDATTGAQQARYDEARATTANTTSVTASPSGDRIAVELGAGDHNELRLLDARDLHELPGPALPASAIEIASFSPDGKRLAVTTHDATGPADIASIDLATNVLAPLRREPRNGLVAPRASIEHLRAFDGLTVPVNLYLPPGSQGSRYPTLVLVHGGPSGSSMLAWSSTIAFWISMGFAVVQPNIRGSTGFGIPYQEADDREHRADALHDMETINQWARAQPWCDGDRIIVGGISYGGYMTLLALSRQPTLWRAGIDGSGMSNLKTMEELEDQTIRAIDDTEFGELGRDDALLAEWSPITHVDKIRSPVFVYQGVHDPVTPQHEADQIVHALEARHIPVEYMLLEDEGHGLSRKTNYIAYFARSYRFVASHMGLR